MGNGRWSIVIVLLCLSCRASTRTPAYQPAPAYPLARCGDDSCNGRVTTLGVLERSAGGITQFQFLDLDQSPEHVGKLISVWCDGCPLHPGATYRARMNKDERIYSLMLDGSEIFYLGNKDAATSRTDRLELDWPLSGPQPCDLAVAHWEAVDGVATCLPGTTAPRIAWVSGDGLNPRVPGCSPNFPTGLLNVLGTRTSEDGFYDADESWHPPDRVALSVQLSSSYTLEDPQLAHDVFPQFFVDVLNTFYESDEVARARGLATRTPDDPRFVLADGVPTVTAAVVFDMDATGDHYGMTITMTVPENGAPANLMFYSVPPIYVTGEKLTRAAARRAIELLDWPGGWTCEDGATRSRYSLDEWCSDEILYGEQPELADSWVCQP